MEKTIAVASLLFMACTTAPAPAANNTDQRGTWKADTSSGAEATCAGHCGGRSPGRCYCDDACSGWGDCCPDYQPVCAAPPSDLAQLSQDGGVAPSNPPDLGSSGPTGPSGPSGPTGPTGPSGPSDLGGPWGATDLAPASSDLTSVQAINVQFSADIVPDRTNNWPDAGASAPTVHVFCTLSGSNAYATLDCGSTTTSINLASGASGFMIYLAGGGLLTGNVLSASSVELLKYSYSAINASYSDVWNGDLIVATSPIENVNKSFHGTLSVTRTDSHTYETGPVSVSFSCTVKGPRNNVDVDCGSSQGSANLDGGSFWVSLPLAGTPSMSGVFHGDSPVEVSFYSFYTPDFSDSLSTSAFFPWD